MADSFATIPIRTDVDGDAVVGLVAGTTVAVTGAVLLGAGAASIGSVNINSGQTVGITGVNITANALDVNLTNASVAVTGTVAVSSLPLVTIGTWSAGTLDVNITNPSIAITGTVTVDSITNPLPAGTNTIGKVEISVAGTPETSTSSGTISKNGGTGTVDSSVITNGSTATLRSVIVGSSVAMRCDIRTDDTVSPVIIGTCYIPVGGGTVEFPFLSGSVTLAGTAAGENFDVVFTNLDKKDDADAYATFFFTEE